MLMSETESEIERYLVQQTLCRGGDCVKLARPGGRGMPDRLVLMPGGWACFVECKREKRNTVRPWQKQTIRRFRALGHRALIIRRKEEVDAMFRTWETTHRLGWG
jgi:Holliday junction resolvase